MTTRAHVLINTEVVSCVWIAIPAWEVAARDIQPKAMSLLENIARCPQVYFVLVGFSWLDQRWSLSLREVAIASAIDTVGQILRIAIGIDIDQACHKIGVRRA